MSEDVGKILEILDNAELSDLYRTSIRKMQPAELVRRLKSENVSTRGHMPELRGRLLRLQAKKYPRIEVPWFPEDEIPKQDIAQENDEINKVCKQLTELPFRKAKDNSEIRKVAKKLVDLPIRSAEETNEKSKISHQVSHGSRRMKKRVHALTFKAAERDEKKNGGKASFKLRKNYPTRPLGRLPIPYSTNYLDKCREFDQKKPHNIRKCVDDQEWLEAIHKIMKLKLENSESEMKNTNDISKKMRDTSKSEESELPPKVPSTNSLNKSTSSTSNTKQEAFNMWTVTLNKDREFSDDQDDDPFENVDSDDWMDDYLD